MATGPDDPWNRAVDADRLAAFGEAKAGITADALVTITAVATRSRDLRDMIISVRFGFNKCRIGIYVQSAGDEPAFENGLLPARSRPDVAFVDC